MKILKTTAILTLAILLLGIFADAQKKTIEPKTVLDFYLLLPKDALAPLAQIKNRQSLIQIKDLVNGYLKLEAVGAAATESGWEGWGEIALFKKTAGGYVVSVVDGSNATMHYSGIEFYEYAGGKWRTVTAEIFPDVSSDAVLKRYKSRVPNDTEYDAQNPPFTYFELPRRGTTVKMFADAEDEGALFEFVWTGAKFELKK